MVSYTDSRMMTRCLLYREGQFRITEDRNSVCWDKNCEGWLVGGGGNGVEGIGIVVGWCYVLHNRIMKYFCCIEKDSLG